MVSRLIDGGCQAEGCFLVRQVDREYDVVPALSVVRSNQLAAESGDQLASSLPPLADLLDCPRALIRELRHENVRRHRSAPNCKIDLLLACRGGFGLGYQAFYQSIG